MISTVLKQIQPQKVKKKAVYFDKTQHVIFFLSAHWTPKQHNETTRPTADQYPTYISFFTFNCCLSVVLQLEEEAYPENSRVVFGHNTCFYFIFKRNSPSEAKLLVCLEEVKRLIGVIYWNPTFKYSTAICLLNVCVSGVPPAGRFFFSFNYYYYYYQKVVPEIFPVVASENNSSLTPCTPRGPLPSIISKRQLPVSSTIERQALYDQEIY